MFSKVISILLVIAVLTTNTAVAAAPAPKASLFGKEVLATKQYSLSDRYSNAFVNDVFADNILLTLAYMRGLVKKGQPVDWNSVTSPFTYTMLLKPGQTFAFHDEVLPEYEGKNLVTTNAHFDSAEGFKSDGWLYGDGVCHLASFMNVVAREAGLGVLSPTPHNFAAIPDVPRELAIAVYTSPYDIVGSGKQNLYVTNTFASTVAFVFTYDGKNLQIKVEIQG